MLLEASARTRRSQSRNRIGRRITTFVSTLIAALIAPPALAQERQTMTTTTTGDDIRIVVPHETPDITRPTGDDALGVPMPAGDLGPEVYRERRRTLMQHIMDTGGGVTVIFGADSIGDGGRQDLNFYYLTGINAEPGSALLLAPENDAYTETLYLKTLDVEDNVWHGHRAKLGRAIELGTGIAKVHRTSRLPGALAQAVLRSESKQLVFLGPVVGFSSPIPKALSTMRDAAARIPGASVRLDNEVLPRMRQTKSEAELVLMRRASDATKQGHVAAMKAARVGMTESALRRVFEDAFFEAGCERTAYTPIVAGGPNSCVLHYPAVSPMGQRKFEAGDLVLCDVGAEYQGYANDVTRTWPVDGTFTARQREVYEVVLAAQEAAIAAIKPGVTVHELHMIARNVIEQAGYTDDMPHGLSHFIGLDVHDTGLYDEPLTPGSLITVEPGIYLPEEEIGIRIEDVILVTETGHENLTAGLAKTVDEIEALMAQ